MFSLKSLGLPAALLGLLATLATVPVFADTDSKDLGAILAANANLSTYYDLIQKYPDILLQLPNYAGVTIIAPSNDAFDKYQGWSNDNKTLVTNILEYHILQGTVAAGAIEEGVPVFPSTLLRDTRFTNVTGGQKLRIDKQAGDVVVLTSGEGSRSTLLEADITFTGGLVQMVDTLLVPPARLEPTARDSYQDLRAFLGALYAADLVPEFANSPNVTIFAPRNAAFQLLAGTLSGLSDDELKRVLSYHLVPNQLVVSTDLKNGTNLTSSATDAAGSPIAIHITAAGNNRYIDSAQLLVPDILVANGIVHMIDNVLNPDAAAVRPNPDIGTQPPVFPLTGATATGSKAAVPFTTDLPCTSDCPVTTSAASGNATGDAATATSTDGLRSSSSHGGAAGFPRCTGVVGAAAGAIGMGMLGVAAVL